MKSILDIKEEMNFIRSYMENYRNQRNNILRDETKSSDLRKKYLNDLEWERDQVLMVIPLLKERANLPTSDLFGF